MNKNLKIGSAGFRLALALIAAGVVLLTAFVLIPSSLAVTLIREAGYWVVAVVFLLWAGFLFRTLRQSRPRWRELWQRHRYGLAVILLCAVFLHVHEPHRFKILADEYLLAATSMNMHYEREASYPVRAHYVNGVYQGVNDLVDKRPLFYPFLVSVLHDLSGYRPANAIILNGLLTLVLLGLVYGWGAREGGWIYGSIGVLLLSGIPLVAQSVTGAGFGVLNLCLIAGLLHAGARYMKRPGTEGLSLLILTALLLSQVRYESLLFLGVVPLLALAKWSREKRITLGWFHVITPVLAMPSLLLNLIHQENERFWQLASKEAQDPFGLQYLSDNFAHAVYYLFNIEGYQTNAVFVSVLGVLSGVLLLVWLGRNLPRLVREAGPELVHVCVLLGVLGNAILLSFYFWGQIDDRVITRLSLPWHLIFVLNTVFILWRVVGSVRWTRYLPVGLGIWLVGMMGPVMARGHQTGHLFFSREAAWVLEQLETFDKERTLLLAGRPIPMLAHRYAALPVKLANRRRAQVAFALEYGLYDEILYFESVQLDPGTLEPRVLYRDKLAPCFETETVATTRYRPHTLTRLSRITGVEMDEVERDAITMPEEGFDNMADLRVFLRQQYP